MTFLLVRFNFFFASALDSKATGDNPNMEYEG